MTTEKKNTEDSPKQERQRSPNYPAIGLEKAIERTIDLHTRSKKHFSAAKILLEGWDYKSKSSVGRQVIAAMKAFGLIETQGSAEDLEIKISEDAYDALVLNGPNKQEIIKRMALKPAIHLKLWEKYGGDFPEDNALKYFLVKDMRFNNDAVGGFIDQFKGTISFAKLERGDTVGDVADNKPQEKQQDMQHDKQKNDANPVLPVSPLREIPIFLDENKFVKVPYPITEEDFDLLLQQLNALKGRLIKQPAPQGNQGT